MSEEREIIISSKKKGQEDMRFKILYYICVFICLGSIISLFQSLISVIYIGLNIQMYWAFPFSYFGAVAGMIISSAIIVLCLILMKSFRERGNLKGVKQDVRELFGE